MRFTTSRKLVLLSSITTAAVLTTAGMALGVLNSPFPGTPERSEKTGSNVTLTDALGTFDKTYRFDRNHTWNQLDRTTVNCHGGRADVRWFVGNLEPTIPDTGIHLSILMDGKKISTILKGSTRGVYDDDEATIHTVVPCPAGSHVFSMRIDYIEGRWGIPYADPGDRVQRGFIIHEVW